MRRLSCLRGISTLTGFALAVEIGDWDRFTGSSIGPYLGLVPSEGLLRPEPRARRHHQDRQHPRAKAAGRSGVASPHDLPRPRRDVAAPLGPGPGRRRGTSGHAGNQRLHQRWVNLNLRKKRSVIANVAVARELAGWCWSLAVLPD